MKKLTISLFLLLTVFVLSAANFKIDIDGREKNIPLKAGRQVSGIRAVNPSWAGAQSKSYLCFEGGVSSDWKTHSITFTPGATGTVSLNIRGSYKTPPAADWIAYDNFRATGTTILNPSLEKLIANAPANWSSGHYGIVTGDGKASHGKNYMASSHNTFVTQSIPVKANVPVTIVFDAKFDRSTPGQGHPESPLLKQKNRFVVKRDLSKAARIRIEIDARQFNRNIVKTSASKGLIIRADEQFGPDKNSCFEVIGTEDLTNDWQEFEFSFAIDTQTDTKINFRSQPVPGEERWVAYDDLKIKGVKHYNPSFESLRSATEFANWASVGYNIAANKPDAAHGKNYALASYDHAIRHWIYPWEVVTIKFKAKNGGSGKAGAPYGVIFEKPRSYYRMYNSQAKYLPLSDKGISPETAGFDPKAKIPPKVYPEFAKPAGKASAAAQELIPFELLEESGVARKVNVRVGIPLPEKSFYNLKNFVVKDPAGKEVPAQYSAIAWWPDKSIKSVLVEFQTVLKANEKSLWHLAAGKNVKQSDYKSALSYTEKDGKIAVSTGVLTATIDKKNFSLLSDVTVNGKKVGSFAPEGLKVVDEKGKVFTASALSPARFAVEEKGPVRLVFRVDGKISDGKNAIADYVARIGFNAGSSKVDFVLSYYNTNLKTEFTDIDSYGFTFVPEAKSQSLQIDNWGGKRIFQRNDLNLQVGTNFVKGRDARLSGGGKVATADGKITFAVKDFWQRYPKAVNIKDGKIEFELLPVTDDKKFNTDIPWYLQFPFCEGKYRMKWGMGFTEEVAIDFAGNISGKELAAKSVLPVIDRNWLFKTRVFEGTLPKNINAFDAWDSKMVMAFIDHMAIKDRQREYGFFNYGDNFGERGRNWNNNEYDFANGLFMLFLRTGRRDVGRWAFYCARHQADVDIVHAYPDPLYLGANAQHSIGHTGVSYQAVNPATWSYKYDAAYRGINGHTWSDGMLHTWMYTGDAVTMDSALMLGNHLVYYTAPGFTRLGTHERSAGWSVRAILAFYRATGDKRYFNAAKHIVNKALAEQNFEKGGAWPHPMPGDHSGGHKNTFGNCPYLMGILSEMMRQYYRVDPRPEVKKSLIAVGGWLRRTHFKDAIGWPYGASWDAKPYHGPGNNTNGLIAPGLLAGGRLEKNPENYEIAQNIINFATLQGYSGFNNNLAMGIVFAAGIIDEMGAFARENPQVEAFDGDLSKFIERVKAATDFRSRGAVKKEFRIILNADTAAIEITRNRHGSRPKANPEYTVQVVDPTGKVIVSKTNSINSNERLKTVLKGKKGDEFKVLIDDDMTGVWNVNSGKTHSSFAVLLPGYSCANGGMSLRYATIPAGTDKFSLNFMPVHPGGLTVYVCNENGKILKQGFAFNSGASRLPWINTANQPAADATIEVDVPPKDKAQNCKIIFVSGGDIAFNLKGIPNVVSVGPALYPVK